MRPRSVEPEGHTLRWWEDGEGFPVVLIHGVPTGAQLWRHVVPRVTGAWCLAWEMPGYGSSIPEGEHLDLDLASQTRWFLRFLDAVGVDRAILVGHELGGGLAQRVVTLHPDRCAGLVLVSSVAYDRWPALPARLLRATRALARHLPDRAFAAGMRAFVARGHDDPAEAAASAEIHLAPYLRHGGIVPLLRQVAALDARDTALVAHLLRDVRVPVRIVWGTEDPWQTLDVGERLARDLGVPLRKIRGARHFLPEDHPEFVAGAIHEVLAEVTASFPKVPWVSRSAPVA